jgi:uncharacterized protein (DUF342 family)
MPNYEYDPEIAVQELYERIIKHEATGQDIQTISANFVSTAKPLLSGSASPNLQYTDNIEHDSETNTYFAKEPGYVHYGHQQLKLLPFFHINKTKTTCHAVVPASSQTKEIISLAILRNLCNILGIEIPVPDENLNDIIQLFNNNEGGLYLVCKGKEPVNGSTEIVNLQYNTETSIGTQDASGNIDYKNKNFVNNVHKNDLIATYTPPVEPEPGRTIFNTVAEPKLLKPDTYKKGKGLVLLEEENLIVAEFDGVLHVTEDKVISVSNEEIIRGDVDLNVGNLNVNGNLTIEGSILQGYSVKASGNITVQGNIEEASVECGGDLLVEGGIIGSPETDINVTGTLTTNFIRNGNITSGEDIHVATSIMSSHITSNGAVYATAEKKGKVVGGTISGRRGIEVWSAGNLSGVKTTLIAGVDLERERQLKEIHQKIKENKEMILKLKKALGNNYFENPKVFFQRLPKAKLPQVKKIVEALKASIQMKKQLDTDLLQLEQDGAEDKEAHIIFLKEAHEGTVVQICSRIHPLDSGVPSPTRFIYDRESKEVLPMSVSSAHS